MVSPPSDDSQPCHLWGVMESNVGAGPPPAFRASSGIWETVKIIERSVHIMFRRCFRLISGVVSALLSGVVSGLCPALFLELFPTPSGVASA